MILPEVLKFRFQSKKIKLTFYILFVDLTEEAMVFKGTKPLDPTAVAWLGVFFL